VDNESSLASTVTTVIIIEPSKPKELLPFSMSAYGLSPREEELAKLVVRGLFTTRTISCNITPGSSARWLTMLANAASTEALVRGSATISPIFGLGIPAKSTLGALPAPLFQTVS
jgi:hypothetical protein